jgi:hypothetical protein
VSTTPGGSKPRRDTEVLRLGRVLAALQRMDADERERAMRYLIARFDCHCVHCRDA